MLEEQYLHRAVLCLRCLKLSRYLYQLPLRIEKIDADVINELKHVSPVVEMSLSTRM